MLTEEQEARQAAEAAVALRDDFLAMAAHELRTPLTLLRGSLQLLRRFVARGASGEHLERLAERAERQQERLTRLVVALLDVTRLERGHLTVERVPPDLGELVQRVVEQEQTSWEPTRELRLEVDPAEAPERVVEGDDLRLEQVLVNHLENARKYSPPNTSLTVRVWTRDGQVHVAVTDAGVGIPAAEHEAIFERFQRGSMIDPHIGGFGLGLYLARQIAVAHGGTLTVASTLGADSTFTLTLPRSAGA